MRNKATKKNMDLDLRRYGKMLYSKAEKSGGSGGDEGGSGEGNSNIFFSPLAIQPSYYMPEDNPTIHEIQDIANTISSNYSDEKDMLLFYSKEQVINLGINESILNNLQQVTYSEYIEDSESGGSKSHNDDENLYYLLLNNYIINRVIFVNGSLICERVVMRDRAQYGIYKFGDDMYLFSYISES